MRVFIVEASYHSDFYDETLDGKTAQTLLNTISVDNRLRIALDLKHIRKAIREAMGGSFDVIHLSCHGDDNGICVGKPSRYLTWETFAELFQAPPGDVPALVMSSCCGVASGIGSAFRDSKKRPPFIFGSTESLDYHDYCAAWALLYRLFNSKGVSRETAMVGMEQITAVVHPSFLYRRWDDDKQKYKNYPREGERYTVQRV